MSKPKTKNSKLTTSPTVFVGLSGGVDSAVSAAILKKEGYDVVGVFIKVWEPDFFECTWREDRRDAMRVCAHLDIPFVTLDLEEEYKKEVVDYMIREYKEGRTPNPDVMCNKEIKFGAFYDFAMKKGADYVATGHYARKELTTNNKQPTRIKNKELRIENRKGEKEYVIKEGKDKSKDQSYFLWGVKKEQLPKILFPVGGMAKPKVRQLANKFKLPNSEKKDSQGLCFLGKVDMKEFLSHFVKEKKGEVLDTKGNVIGFHPGAVFFTIGQRHGFTVTNKKDLSKPLYIIDKDVKENKLVVSPLEPKDISSLGDKECELEEVNWFIEPKEGKKYRIRFRYHQEPLKGEVFEDLDGWKIELEKPFAGISPGQSAVIYDGTIMIGGGIIKKKED